MNIQLAPHMKVLCLPSDLSRCFIMHMQGLYVQSINLSNTADPINIIADRKILAFNSAGAESLWHAPVVGGGQPSSVCTCSPPHRHWYSPQMAVRE